MRKKILILSTDETFRGPLAVAMLRRLTADRYEVTMPGNPLVHPFVSEILAEIGIDSARPGPASPEHMRFHAVDFVITISDRAQSPIVTSTPVIHWRVQRPQREDGSISMDTLRQVRDQIKKCALRFVWHEVAMTPNRRKKEN